MGHHAVGWEAAYRTREGDAYETPHGGCYGREALRLLLDEILQSARSTLQESCAAVAAARCLMSIAGSKLMVLGWAMQ